MIWSWKLLKDSSLGNFWNNLKCPRLSRRSWWISWCFMRSTIKENLKKENSTYETHLQIHIRHSFIYYILDARNQCSCKILNTHSSKANQGFEELKTHKRFRDFQNIESYSKRFEFPQYWKTDRIMSFETRDSKSYVFSFFQFKCTCFTINHQYNLQFVSCK